MNKTIKLPWFRTYTEMIDDEKLRLLAFEDRWHFVAILCLKGAGIIDEGGDLLFRKVAVKMGVQTRELEEIARRLAEVGLIDQETLQPTAWDARQMKSDTDSSAAERKRRQRAREKERKNNGLHDVTDASRVTVTDVTRTDTDTDKEEERESDANEKSAAKPLVPRCPHEQLIDIFAEHLPMLPKPRTELWKGTRARDMRNRWRWVLTAKKRSGKAYAETPDEAIDFFRRFFGYVARSDFLTGRNGKWPGCTLAWLMEEPNFAKVMEGNYDNPDGEVAA